jgi:hypothetical protein
MCNEMEEKALIGGLENADVQWKYTRYMQVRGTPLNVDVQRKRAERSHWPIRATPLNADVQRKYRRYVLVRGTLLNVDVQPKQVKCCYWPVKDTTLNAHMQRK